MKKITEGYYYMLKGQGTAVFQALRKEMGGTGFKLVRVTTGKCSPQSVLMECNDYVEDDEVLLVGTSKAIVTRNGRHLHAGDRFIITKASDVNISYLTGKILGLVSYDIPTYRVSVMLPSGLVINDFPLSAFVSVSIKRR